VNTVTPQGWAAWLLSVALGATVSVAQAPPSIQFFMPDGSLPPREIRFTLTTDDGRVDIFYTDSKGRFLITRSQGLRPDNGYTVTVESDGRVYDTTTVHFKYYNVYYIPVFLKALSPKVSVPGGSIDLAEFDANTSADAKEAYGSGMRAIRENRWDAALSDLQRAVEIDPRYFRALNDLGVLYLKLNRLADASAVFERARELAPKVYFPRLNLGIVRTRQGRFAEAIDLLEEIHRQDPRLVEARILLADAMIESDSLKEAERHLRGALEDSRLEASARAEARYKLGCVLVRREQYRAAVKELESVLAVYPDPARVHLQLGAALVEMKQPARAEQELLEAYRLRGAELGVAQFLLGQLYFTQKKYDLALKAFKQYLADVPSAPNAAEVSALIERFR
jgi:tetratricopeptide (TPR) repeat protein